MPLAALAALLILGPQSVAYHVLRDGQRVGDATLTQTLREDGAKVVEMQMTLRAPDGRTVNTSTKSVYSVTGKPVRREQSTRLDVPRYERSVTASFHDSGANVVVVQDGKRAVRNVPLVRAAPLDNPSEFWFLRDRPRVGLSVVSYQLNLESLEWEPVRTTYHGLLRTTWGGQPVEAHRVESEKGVAFLSDDGTPLVIEAPPYRLERTEGLGPGAFSRA